MPSPFYWPDVSEPLVSQRFYSELASACERGSKAGPLGDGAGHHVSVRVDSIYAVGPTDTRFTLDTVTLTNSTQLYFDVGAPFYPERLYRLVALP